MHVILVNLGDRHFEDIFVSLEHIFEARVKRAANVLAAPQAGPKYIRFTSADLSSPDALSRLHARFPAKATATHYLYQVTLEGKHSQLIARARSAFRRARLTESRSMSRDNSAHQESRSIYVGTSKNMFDRFRSHLGTGTGTTTWGLYLSAWAVPIGAKFLVEYYEFKDSIDEDIELIEGVLWDSLRPLFGKKGGK